MLQLPILRLVATTIVQIKEGQAMIQRLILAVMMTFALNLLVGIDPPANNQAAFSDEIDFVQILKVRIINHAFVASDK